MELRAAAIFWLCIAFEFGAFLGGGSCCYLHEGLESLVVHRLWSVGRPFLNSAYYSI